MREIKFKAWHKTLKQMLVVYVICQQRNTDGYVRECKGFWGINNQVVFSYDQVEWLQFTGLKDKNGKEIYEGDILKTWYSRDTTGKDIIEYHYEVEHEINSYNGKSGFQIDFLQNCEVVGNIYETPHLMISEQSPERIVETDAKSRL